MGLLPTAKRGHTGLPLRLGMERPFLSFSPVKEVAEETSEKDVCVPVGGGEVLAPRSHRCNLLPG